MSKHFGQIVVCDFEYETSGGEYQLVAGDLPKPLCMVAYVLNGNLEYVHTIKLWRGNFGPKPPFDIGPDTLFVGYSTWAELTCFLVLGWKCPQHIFDLHTAYLAASNILRPYDADEIYKKPRKRLPDACRAYGIKGWENIDKEAMSKGIGEGRWRDYGQEAVLDYCQADVDASVKLLRAQVRSRIDSDLVLHWSNYSGKVVAQVQARGMLIDMELWNLVQENKAAVILDLLRQFDPSFGSANSIYNLDGSTSYDQLERWLTSAGVTAWPHLESGKLDTRGDAFRLMYHVPGIEGLHALRDSLRVITGASLPIGRDGLNRPSLFPFGTTTGRNAHARSLYNAHAGMRSFMVFPPDKIGVYLDWRTQEVAVAASRSEDQALINAYLGGDVYYAFARDSGLTTDPDQIHWKKHDKPMRQRVKALQLAVNYGIGVPSLAKGLDRHPLIASYLIEKHRRMYPCFWQWREDQVQIAMLDRRLESVFGWPLHLSTSPNKRTLYNFPMQSGGAEMLRLAAWRLCEAGLIPNMLVHDAILLELDNEEQVAHAIEIMRKAGQDVCDGLDVGVDVNQLLKHGETLPRRPTNGAEDVEDNHEHVGEYWCHAEAGCVMTNVHYVYRHGRRIEVETLDTGFGPKPKGRFVKVPLTWIERLNAINASASTYRVAHHILHQVWRRKQLTVKLTNVGLTHVSRPSKRAALTQLEKAGLIAIERVPHKSPLVTVLQVD